MGEGRKGLIKTGRGSVGEREKSMVGNRREKGRGGERGGGERER